MPQNQSIESLYKRYLANELDTEELAGFLQRLHNTTDEETVSRLMDGTWKEMYEQGKTQAPVVPLYKKSIFKWIAAASVIIVVGVAVFSLLTKHPSTTPPTATTNDVQAPSETRAVITLANGQKVYLDSVSNGTIAQENNVSVVKNNNGEIVYNSTAQPLNNSTQYNTLFNPRGSKVISLTLSDGTKVWLNSESSLRYPASFASAAVNRDVEVTGEAYFEVKHNSKQPFKVHLPNGSIVEDLGTAFNINSYADENDIKTTLVEGSVKITNTISNSPASSVTLRPGEQSTQSISNRVIRVQNNVDMDEVLSWKSGWFDFDNITLPAIMRQLSRWYDIDVVYQASPSSETYGGRISKDLSLSNVLHSLEANGAKFRVEGRKITVLK
jgi:transmembrane sensor